MFASARYQPTTTKTEAAMRRSVFTPITPRLLQDVGRRVLKSHEGTDDDAAAADSDNN